MHVETVETYLLLCGESIGFYYSCKNCGLGSGDIQ